MKVKTRSRTLYFIQNSITGDWLSEMDSGIGIWYWRRDTIKKPHCEPLLFSGGPMLDRMIREIDEYKAVLSDKRPGRPSRASFKIKRKRT